MKKVLKSLIAIILMVVIGYLFLPSYVQTAILHGTPDIDDYKIFYNRSITKGMPQAWEKSERYNSYEFAAEDRTALESFEPVAYLVIKDGKLLYEEYWDGYNDHSLSNSFSAGKTIVSLLIGIAIDEGYIKSVDQKVKDFIPAYDCPENKNLSIRNLLTMSSGLSWDEAYSSPFSMTTEAYYGTDLRSLIESLKVVKEPGKQFEYLSGNTEVLAMIVQAATGRSISEYTSEKIWQKIGAEHDALWSLDREDGLEKAYCCFNTNVRDFARFGQLVLNRGRWDSTQIVSWDYLQQATAPASYLKDEDGKTLEYYGFQYWIIDYKDMKIPYMRGILGQYVLPIKEKNAIVVRLGHDRSHEYIKHHPKDVYLYLDLAMKILEEAEDK